MTPGLAVDAVTFALLTAVLWGIEPVFSKRGLTNGGSSLQGTLVVIVVGSTLYWSLLLVWLGPGGILAGVSVTTIGTFLVSGLVGTAMGRLLAFAGIDRVGATVASAAMNTRPLFATVLGVTLLGEVVTPVMAVGILLIVTGIVALPLARGGEIGGWRPRSIAFPLGAALAFATGNVIRRFGLTEAPISALEAVALNEAAGFVALAAFAVAAGRGDVLTAPRRSYLYFAGSGLMTGVALLSLFEALRLGAVSLVDPLVGTSPLVAALLAYLYLGDVERVTRGVVVGAVLVVTGAAILSVLG